jgi:hypothetical protein
MAPTIKQKKLTFTRDGEQCVWCGATQGLAVHHRKNRQAGGSKLRDHLANYLTACYICNGQFEDNLMERARLLGVKLQQWEDPYRTAVFFKFFDEWRLLDDDGTFRVVDGRDIREVQN